MYAFYFTHKNNIKCFTPLPLEFGARSGQMLIVVCLYVDTTLMFIVRKFASVTVVLSF